MMRKWKKRSVNGESWISRYKFQVGLLHIFPLLKFRAGIGTRLYIFIIYGTFKVCFILNFINIRKRI